MAKSSVSAALTRRSFNGFGLAAGLTIFAPAILPAEEKQGGTKIPFLRGVNFTGLSDQLGSQAPARPAVDYYIRRKKMNVVRLNFPWEFVQPQLKGPLDPGQASIIQDQVDRITGAGAFIILEFHNYGRRSINGQAHIIGEAPDVTVADFCDAWTRMARQWKDNPRVIFSLMNEPHDQDIATLVEVSNAAIAAIRATGAGNLIMVSGNDWNSMAWRAGSENQAHMLGITDPLDHFCFDVHHYFDDWSRGQEPNVRADPIAPMQAFLDWAKANRRRGFCGEFACAVNRAGLDACRSLLDLIEGNPDVFMGWAWWGGGGPWQPDYLFLLDPFASITSPTNPDPEGSVTWADPVDRPQMKLLQHYLPGATPFNGWLIEDALAPSIKALYRHGDFDAATGAWIDSGPAGKNATPGWASQPKREEDGGVTFAAGGQYLVADFAGGGAESVYALVKMPAANAGDMRTILGSDTQGGRQFALTGKGGLAVMPSGGGSPVIEAAGPVPADTPTLLQARLAQSAPKHGALDSQLSIATRISGSAGSPIEFADGKTVIGAADDSGNQSLDGTLYDLAIFGQALSEEDNARVQGRFYWDRGMAHLLPDDHPYRRRAPSIG